jgi:hypothetical protein
LFGANTKLNLQKDNIITNNYVHKYQKYYDLFHDLKYNPQKYMNDTNRKNIFSIDFDNLKTDDISKEDLLTLKNTKIFLNENTDVNGNDDQKVIDNNGNDDKKVNDGSSDDPNNNSMTLKESISLEIFKNNVLLELNNINLTDFPNINNDSNIDNNNNFQPTIPNNNDNNNFESTLINKNENNFEPIILNNNESTLMNNENNNFDSTIPNNNDNNNFESTLINNNENNFEPTILNNNENNNFESTLNNKENNFESTPFNNSNNENNNTEKLSLLNENELNDNFKVEEVNEN